MVRARFLLIMAAATVLPAAPVRASRSDVVARASRSVVTVRTGDSLGTAFAYGAAGRLLTNAHVVGDASSVRLTTQRGTELAAAVVKRDEATDIAVLSASDSDALKPLGKATHPVRAGDDVMAIGAPSGLGGTVTRGIVSTSRRRVDGREMIQTDSAVNPGNSGGPLLTEEGDVVGVTTSKSAGEEGIAFAVPIGAAEDAESGPAATSQPPGGPSLGWCLAAAAVLVGGGVATWRGTRRRRPPPAPPVSDPSRIRDAEPLVVVRRNANNATARAGQVGERRSQTWT